MTGGWAATNTLREALSYNIQGPEVMLANEAAALALVEAALDAAELVIAGMTPLRSLPGAVGTIATDDLDALAAALRAVREGK